MDQFDDSDVENLNNGRIKQALEEAGNDSFGVVGVEAWLYDDDGDHFVHVDSTWVDPVFRHTLSKPSAGALDTLVNPSNPNYVIPAPQISGAGLAGYFWSLGVEPVNKHIDAGRPLLWRDIHAIVSDPFQVPYERMNVLLEAGFGKATGIPFDIYGQKGIVMYLTRKNADESMLNERRNARFLRFAAQNIGIACALTTPKREALEAKHNLMSKTYRRIQAKIKCICAISSLRFDIPSDDDDDFIQDIGSDDKFWKSFRKSMIDISSITSSFRQTCWGSIKGFFKNFASNTLNRLIHAKKKMKGSNLKPPPPAPWSSALWTFTGVFLTLLVLHTLSDAFKHITSDKYKIILAPFGALLTLQFGLTPAPPSQPFAIVYGQITSTTIALLSRKIMLDIIGLHKLFVVPFSASAAIAAMCKLGCPHPPAAAAVIALFAQKDGFDIFTVLCLLAGNVVAICCSTLINNLCENRQYPMYWQFGLDRIIPWFRSKIKPREK